MCGIAGFVDPKGGDADALDGTARAMAAAIRHRGPDGAGTWSDPGRGVAFGHRRLAILDPTPNGAQPMVSDGGRYVVTFNGEIYNFRALRAELAAAGAAFRGTGDTEVLLAAVAAWGVEAAVARLVGMFAFALYDRRAGVLHLLRDRAGEKPLYYGVQDGRLLFGSELRALRRHPAFDGAVDRDALAGYLEVGCVPAPRSIHRDIAKLPPGGHLAVPLDAPLPDTAALMARVRTYWRARDAAAAGPSADPEAAFAEVERCLTEAVRGAMVADVPLGAFLSGGLDSSTVVATMQALSDRPVKTFTVGFEDAVLDEAAHAREVAAQLGTEHTELTVTGADARAVVPELPAIYDEPFADASQIPTALIARLARRQVTVALTGDGGDELFCGYTRHLLARALAGRIAPLPRPLRAGAAGLLRTLPPGAWDRALAALGRRRPGLTGAQLHKLARCLHHEPAGGLYRAIRADWPGAGRLVPGARPAPDLASGTDPGDPAAAFMLRDFETYLPDAVLAKVDRAAMASSLETRVPLLDHRLVAAAWRLPMAAKLQGGRGKWPLRRILARHLPAELIDRPKQGFSVPLDAWLRGPLRDWAEDLLRPEALAADDLLDPAPVRRAWSAHLAGRRDHGQALWHVLMLQAWRRGGG
jgi:asparagine synthase (glutamine-hydrolysing)